MLRVRAPGACASVGCLAGARRAAHRNCHSGSGRARQATTAAVLRGMQRISAVLATVMRRPSLAAGGQRAPSPTQRVVPPSARAAPCIQVCRRRRCASQWGGKAVRYAHLRCTTRHGSVKGPCRSFAQNTATHPRSRSDNNTSPTRDQQRAGQPAATRRRRSATGRTDCWA